MEDNEKYSLGTVVQLKNTITPPFKMLINQYIEETKQAVDDEFTIFYGYECVWHSEGGIPQKEIYRHEVLRIA